ncbi:MAG: hypothetical protein A3H42_01670 [Deltaproteobacteria bacterium RIFCSPLOWO2_02_FULL_46_8]|nr:MAG: hypothetical protein A3H42_01670 [Deltaproteobacteria bacterium RIFCSPLOWO2_02_FULL_46_8]
MTAGLQSFLDEKAQIQQPKVVREPYLAGKVVFVDGLPGCGKTMLSPIVGALPRVQLFQYSYPIEYVCSLRHLGRLDLDVASTLVRMLTDLQLYNVMMGRETNFRLSDLSSVFQNARPHLYFKRLFQAGDTAVIPKIEREKPILNLATHNILPFAEPIQEALGSRVLIVEVVRHPLYMIKQQSLYQNRYGTDPRDFTVWFDYQGHALPYFAHGWEEIFLNANETDRSIYMIYFLQKKIANIKNGNIIEIPFEKFVLNPWPFMEKIVSELGSHLDDVARKMMKKQKVPRQRIADGIPLEIYKQNGWEPPARGCEEKDELKIRRSFAEKRASKEALRILDELSQTYEERFFRI